ncbi:hypothetical protein ABT354_19825 [Streptomyces sp. NPDC000594]|uniref:hypothetical protein n=1 Tax=Streptomyces sp. NPDC000594 TaxID=3154261 RepID=UPI00331A6428
MPPRTRADRFRLPGAHRGAAVAAAAALLAPLWVLLTAPRAQAVPSPCDLPVVTVACDLWDGAGTAADFLTDPLGFIATKMGEAAAWFLEQIIKLMESTTTVDFTNPGFLKSYGLMAAVSAIFTVILWLIAVGKRAVAGVSPMTAMSEAVGLLLVQVLVSAFTPAALLYANRAVDEITKVFAGSAIKDGQQFVEKMTKVIGTTQPLNLPVVMIAVFLLLIVAALLVWIELLVRAGALYVGALVGPLVAAGLVDRDLWPRCKKWVGMLLALLLAKPVLFALFGMAAAIMNSEKSDGADAVHTLLVGTLLLFLAVFSSATIYKWLPAFGDQMGDLMNTRKGAAQSGPLAAVPGPAQAASSAMNARMMSSPVVGKGAAAAGPAGAAAVAVKAGADAMQKKAESANTIADHGAGEGSSTSSGAPSDTQAPSTVPSDPGGSSVVPTDGDTASAAGPSGSGGSTPTGPSVVPGDDDADTGSMPSDTPGAAANPAGPSVVPVTGSSTPGTGSASPDRSAAAANPAGPSVVPGPDGTTPGSGPATADTTGAAANPAGPSTVAVPPAAPSSEPAQGTAPGEPAAPAVASSNRPTGTASRAVPSTVPTPSAPGTPSQPSNQGSEQ